MIKASDSTISVCGVLTLLCSATVVDADDSWDHYVGGGMYHTRSPALSDDGKTLFYSTPCSGHGDIYSLTRGDATPVRLTSSDAFESSPVVVPKSNKIIYCRERGKDRHLWSMTKNGEEQRQITFGAFNDDPLVVGPNGSSLLFQRSIVNAQGVRIASVHCLPLGKQTVSSMRIGLAAVFSSDGKHVVFTDDLINMKRRAIGSETKDTQEFQGTGIPLAMSPNGRYLLTSVSTLKPQASPVDWELWVEDLDHHTRKLLAHGHSGTLFGIKKTYAVFWKGFAKSPTLLDVEGDGKSMEIDCGNSHKTFPWICESGRGVLFQGFHRTGEPECDVFHISSTTLTATRLASIACTKVDNTLNMLDE